MIRALESYGIAITIYDPWADPEEVERVYGLPLTNTLPQDQYQAIVLAVAHQEFTSLPIQHLLADPSVVYDIKHALKTTVDGRL